MKKFLVALVLFVLFFPLGTPVFADLGVGIGTGKIEVTEELKKGMEYNFPNLVVINTGDETSKYTVDISYDSNQRELLPPREWFTFAPEQFDLQPGESQSVAITLKIPVTGVIPGEYFGYLEGKPIPDIQEGQTSIGISAAAKLTFTIAPSNIFEAIFYYVRNIWIRYQPWTTITTTLIGLLLLRAIFRKFFSFDLNIKPKKKEESTNQ